jgi:hypothetical protein
MFRHLTKALTADCEVLDFGNGKFFYPIFKNGRSSLRCYARQNNLQQFTNKEILQLKNKKITVFLRSPKERFVSGVYTFFYLNNNQIVDDLILKKIESNSIIDRHFAPQFVWLLHLYKYFKGTIEIRSVEELLQLIPNRDGPWTDNPNPWKTITQKEKNQILSIKHKKYVDVDEKIIEKYLNKSVKLESLIIEFKK